MKETIINEIVRTLHEMGIDTDGVTERLYLIFKDVEVSKAETALAVRDDMQNETLLMQFLAAKAVKGCTKNTSSAFVLSFPVGLSNIGLCSSMALLKFIQPSLSVSITSFFNSIPNSFSVSS